MGLFERYTTGDYVYSAVHYAIRRAQTFIIGNTGANLNHNVTKVLLRMCRYAESTGTLTASIREVDGYGYPTGDDLCSGTYNITSLPILPSLAWIPFIFDPSTLLLPDTRYAIVLRTDPDAYGDSFWRLNPEGTYTGGGSYRQSLTPPDYWHPWQPTVGDLVFEEHGAQIFLGLSESLNTIDTAKNFYSPLRLSEIIRPTDTIISVSNKPVYYYEPSTVSQFTLGESDVLEFSGLIQDDSTLRNDIIVIGDAVSANTNDSTSIDAYGRYAFRYEDTEITDSNDAATLASQILANYKDPKTVGSIKIKGKTGIHTRSQFTLNLPNIGINNQKYEIVQYRHEINNKGFHTIIYFGEVPWDLTREVANLLKKVY